MKQVNGEGAFLDPDEVQLEREFLDNGHLVRPVEDRAALDRLRTAIVEMTAPHLGVNAIASPGEFLNSIHDRVGVEALNDLRLAVINGLTELSWARQAYFSAPAAP